MLSLFKEFNPKVNSLILNQNEKLFIIFLKLTVLILIFFPFSRSTRWALAATFVTIRAIVITDR